MKKSLLFLIPAAGLIGFSFLYKSNNLSTYHIDDTEGVDFSANPPTGRTGAPEEGRCTDCHTGDVLSAEGVIDFSVGGGPTYLPGGSYPLIISTLDGVKNGFQITVLDADGNQAGTFDSGDNYTVTSAEGREYAHHSASTGITNWVVNWNAPTSDIGDLTIYYSFNKSNNNGATSGDEIYLGTMDVPADPASGISENVLEKAYKIYFNEQTRELNLNYSLLKEAKVILNIQDLSGRLVEFYDFGLQGQGDYQETLPVTKVDKEGIYILSLFVDNRVMNRKLMLK